MSEIFVLNQVFFEIILSFVYIYFNFIFSPLNKTKTLFFLKHDNDINCYPHLIGSRCSQSPLSPTDYQIIAIGSPTYPTTQMVTIATTHHNPIFQMYININHDVFFTPLSLFFWGLQQTRTK